MALIANSVNEAANILTKLKNESFASKDTVLRMSIPDQKADISSPPETNSGQVLGKLGGVYLNGEELDWNSFYKNKQYNKVNLPNYAFQYQKFWIDEEHFLKENSVSFSFNEKMQENNNTIVETKEQPLLLEKLRRLSHDERHGLLLEEVRKELAKVLQLPPNQLPEINLGFIEMGLDSLMGLELKNKLQSELKYTISSTVLFNYSTIESLVGFLLNEIFKNECKTEIENFYENENATLNLTNVDLISDEEAEAILLQKLESFQKMNA
jgi:acyl carrier protein